MAIAPSTHDAAVPADAAPQKSYRIGSFTLSEAAAITLIAFIVRVLVMTVGHTFRITPRNEHFDFGWEMGRIARAIADGRGFADPLNIPTGPTAWVAPVYPYLLAGIFKLFGVYSNASAWVILTVNSICGALTCWTLHRIALRLFGQPAARWTAWTWALFPYAIYWPIRVVWETSLGAWLLVVTIDVALRLAADSTWKRWLQWGFVWGVIALINPTLCAVMPFQLLWLVLRLGRASWVRAAMACAVCALVMTPWLVRNHETFGRFVFVRDNFGLEMHVANNDQGEGLWTRSLHPANNKAEMVRFQQLGEIAYMQDAQHQAMMFIHENPGLFAKFVAERWVWFWTGKPQNTQLGSWNMKPAQYVAMGLSALLAFAGAWWAVRKRVCGIALLLIPLLVVPLPYALAHPAPRYRHAIEPVMALLIVYLFSVLRVRSLCTRFKQAN